MLSRLVAVALSTANEPTDQELAVMYRWTLQIKFGFSGFISLCSKSLFGVIKLFRRKDRIVLDKTDSRKDNNL